MSFGNRTPESLLTRSDSKNPATTCKGSTAAGRPCRRALAASATNNITSSSSAQGNGVVAILDQGDAAAYFCWQHKEQAEALVTEMSERTQVLPLKQKSSIDTLIERIGVLDLDDEVGDEYHRDTARDKAQPRRRRGDYDAVRSRKRDTLPQEWQSIQGPLMSVPEEVAVYEGYRKPVHSSRSQRRYPEERLGRSNVKASWSCCIRADDETLPPPRRRDARYDRQRSRTRPRDHSTQRSRLDKAHVATRDWYHSPPRSVPVNRKQVDAPQMQQRHSSVVSYPQHEYSPDSSARTPTRPLVQPQVSASPPNSQTVALLSLIPPHLSPATTSTLLSELAKPISTADVEGYIYIFWLTPDSDDSKPDDEIASSLLDPDEFTPASSPSRPSTGSSNGSRSKADRHQSRNSLTVQALQRFASIKHSPAEPTKILLKIGRASNVHRRLSQWTKQCGQNITLIRYYPYQPSGTGSRPVPNSGNASGGGSRMPVPHVHRVERLIHLELADQRVVDKGQCEQCGREHKEWFEVEATREGIRAVDEVVRRWIGWAERNAS